MAAPVFFWRHAVDFAEFAVKISHVGISVFQNRVLNRDIRIQKIETYPVHFYIGQNFRKAFSGPFPDHSADVLGIVSEGGGNRIQRAVDVMFVDELQDLYDTGPYVRASDGGGIADQQDKEQLQKIFHDCGTADIRRNVFAEDILEKQLHFIDFVTVKYGIGEPVPGSEHGGNHEIGDCAFDGQTPEKIAVQKFLVHLQDEDKIIFSQWIDMMDCLFADQTELSLTECCPVVLETDRHLTGIYIRDRDEIVEVRPADGVALTDIYAKPVLKRAFCQCVPQGSVGEVPDLR